MIFGTLLLAWLSSQATAVPTAQPSDCAQVVGARTPAITELCLGNDALMKGESAPKGSVQRTQSFESAAEHYRRAATLARDPETKARALDLLAKTSDAQHLNDPAGEEPVLRELIATVPTELPPIFRLAELQERQAEIDAAEETLLSARRRQPDSTEPYKRLAQFYARRAAALQSVTVKDAFADSAKAGAPDDSGVYRVGGGITPPQRLDVARYPKEAQVAGVQGVVIVEVVVDGSGAVTDAKVVRSIPLLDEEALRAVQNWHFAPTVVNGQPAPVRMNVAVSFKPE